jgi:hypothetical protein
MYRFYNFVMKYLFFLLQVIWMFAPFGMIYYIYYDSFSGFCYMLYLNTDFYLALYSPHKEHTESGQLEVRESNWEKYSNRYREIKLKMWNWT